MRKTSYFICVLFSSLSITFTGVSAQAGVVLWNKLGSQQEIENSDIGLNGIVDASIDNDNFTTGVFGGAYVADYTEDLLVQFPREVVNLAKGAIEFWAKLINYPNVPLSAIDGWIPAFFRLSDPTLPTTYMIRISGNDGKAGGGIIGHAGRGSRATTGSFTDPWTYEAILGVGQVDAWHHYALVWDEDGIAGVDDGTRKVAVFLDGQLDSNRWFTELAGDFPPEITQGSLGLLFNDRNFGSVAIDNIITWDQAKTDFSDRFNEAPVSRDVAIDIKPGNKRNVINPRAKGGIWVAILSDTDPESPFDPSSQVYIPTVEFGPDGAKAIRHKVKDKNKDGLGDLFLRFKIPATGIACGDTEATLSGETFDGQSFSGTDSLKTVGCKKPKNSKKKKHKGK